MMLPILISVSVAPGSYFFWALALLATATTSSPASATDVAWFKTRWCIIVLPDVLAEAHAVFIVRSLVSRRIECSKRSMHDWVEVASQAFAAILAANFRPAEPALGFASRQQRRSNEARDKRS